MSSPVPKDDPPMAWITEQQHRVDLAHQNALRSESEAHHSRNVAGKLAWDTIRAEVLMAESAAAHAVEAEEVCRRRVWRSRMATERGDVGLTETGARGRLEGEEALVRNEIRLLAGSAATQRSNNDVLKDESFLERLRAAQESLSRFRL